MSRIPKFMCALAVGALALSLCLAVPAQDFKSLEGQVVEKTLPNGLKLILLRRPQAPVVSMTTYADVGGVNEQQNATGLAHVFEHMAFKGTTSIGTKDYAAELEAMSKEDDAFNALRAERMRRPKPDEQRLKQLEETFKAAQEAAQKFVKSNELGEILEQEGVSGLNAFTGFDQTVYLYSLPSNKLELWAALESDRFTNPVLREFYKEKDVIMEEKRMGDSNPQGRLLDDFFPVAYKGHMYRSFVIGHLSDLEALRRDQAKSWFDKYYRAKNLTCVVVGDIDVNAVLPMLEKHLGQIPAGEKPEGPVTIEPPQRSEKRIIMEDAAQPFLVIGYHRTDIMDPDDPVYDAISDILGGGRSSRLYKALVKEKKLALFAGAAPSVEGQKFPGLFAFFAVPNQGKTNAECEAAIYDEIERLKREPVTAEELQGVKTRAKVQFIDSVDSNTGIAMQLAFAQNLMGDWREMFRSLDRIEKVTPADIQRVAQKTFVKSNRTVGTIETVKEEAK